MTAHEAMLTTTDNPFNPFTQYDSWYAWDSRHGYHTPSYLDRIVITSEELSPAHQRQVIEEAIDEIVRENINGKYVKVTREIVDQPTPTST